MFITCEQCRQGYDDARCSTLCPHRQFIDDVAAKQKDAALAILGKLVRFTHDPEGVPPARVTTVTWDGMVCLEGWVGEFAPHLFVEAQ